ncbi:LacI family DNA-binding transcriptional regulator [Mesobacillus sp. S13]|uniref:LacI family DNA-binding transcriptional regulator n=1 Tax=Mesobacillus sp. S13 TaxID=2880221 RepID=UPI001CF13282|nr:LacI family DNA-binding transcriptional regulator [Mesobacillus sp. S13]
MAVTIKDVAKAAGVSPSTVSRVIADHPHINEVTKKRVRKVMEKLGYHPNFQARSLVVRSTETIGIVMPNSATQALQNPFFPEVIRGISMKAHEHQFGVYLTTGITDEEIFQQVVSMVQGGRVDGIILLYSKTDDKIMNYLLERKFPFTVIGRPSKNAERITFVDNDNIYITKQVTDYLIKLGHQRIAFIGVNLEHVFTIDRLEGYKQALHEANIQYDEKYVIHEQCLKSGGKQGILKFLSSHEPPTALVVADDFTAIELMSYSEELNIKVPEEISIVSFNDVPLTEHMKPQLTSVNIDIFQLGFEAANCLIEIIKNPDALPKRVTIPARMIERKSCSPIHK